MMLTFRDRFIKISILLTAAFFLVLVFGLLMISYMPFQSVKARVDPFTYDGSADAFTHDLFDKIVVKLRLVATALFFIGLSTFLARDKLLQYISDIVSSAFSLSKEFTRSFCDAIRNEERIHVISLLAIVLIAVTARLFFLFRPILHDEAWTFVHYASKPLYIGLSNYSATNNHLFNTFLTHIAYVLLGNDVWIIRLPSFLAGILLVPASYLVIRIYYNKYAALMTSGAVASSSNLISQSTECRGYTLLCLFFLLILAVAKYLLQTNNKAAWLLFAILSALGFYTIPIMLYPFGIVFVWLSLSIMVRDSNLKQGYLLRELLISLIITVILTLTLYTPVLAVSGLKSLIANQWVAPLPWSQFILQSPPNLLLVWSEWNDLIPSSVKFLLLFGFLISFCFHKRLSTYRVPLIIAIVIWCFPVLIIQRVVPYTRVWLFLLPLYLGVACAGIAYLLISISAKFKSYRSWLFVILTLTLSIWSSLNVIQKGFPSEELMDAEGITLSLRGYLKPGDRVLLNLNEAGAQAPLMYYFKLHDVPFNYLKSDLYSSQRILFISRRFVTQQDLIQRLKERLLDERLLDEKGISDIGFDDPHLIFKFRIKNVYEIKLRPKNPQHSGEK